MNKLILRLLLIVTLVSCASGNISGTKEPSDKQINAEAEKAYAEVKKKSKLSSNKKWTAMVKRVSDRIAKASGEPFKWEVILIDSPQVNAWCMPGGKMAVYTGILPVLKTEAALAAVMGHEVAHATLRHGKKGYVRAINKKYNSILLGGGIALAGELLCNTDDCKKLSQAGALLSVFALEFMDRKFSRSDETDSDRVGQMYMAKAGYDPAEAPRVWQRMKAASGGKAPPEFMSTHPANDKRKDNLKKWLPKAQKEYAKAKIKYGLGERI